MPKVRQNIESTNPVLTLEQKLAVQKQNKACQSWLNAYVKDKNRKALKEKQRLEKEAAKAAKQKHQKSVAPVADVQPEKKAGKEKSEAWKCPVEVLRMLFDANRMALLPLYLTATREKDLLGTVTRQKVLALAERLSRNPNSITRQLAQLEGLGLCKRTGSVWMFTGAQKLTALLGKTRVKMVRVECLQRKYLTTLAFASFISEQGNRIISKAKRKDASILSDGVTIPISASYTANWIGRARTTVSARRTAAKELGLLDFQRQFKHHHTGGIEVKDAFNQARSFNLTSPGEILVERDFGFLWIEELPPIFSSLVHLYTYPIKSKALKALARQRHKAK